METLNKLFELFIAATLINNFVFTMFLGLCIYFGVTKKMETAIGMSITFTSVMTISAALSWVVYNYVMLPLEITFLKIIVFIGIVAAFVQASDTIMRKISPGLYYKLGVRNGDVIRTVNGTPLDSLDKALSLFNTLIESREITLGVERRGAGLDLRYTVR